MLELTGDDPLSESSWKKLDKPIFSSTENIIGPGHCSFVTNDDKESYMIFHSFNDKKNLNLENVNARYLKLNFNNNRE